MLVDLRRELNEITRRIGAGKRGETLAGKETVQRMAKLVEQGYYVIPERSAIPPFAGFW